MTVFAAMSRPFLSEDDECGSSGSSSSFMDEEPSWKESADEMEERNERRDVQIYKDWGDAWYHSWRQNLDEKYSFRRSCPVPINVPPRRWIETWESEKTLFLEERKKTQEVLVEQKKTCQWKAVATVSVSEVSVLSAFNQEGDLDRSPEQKETRGSQGPLRLLTLPRVSCSSIPPQEYRNPSAEAPSSRRLLLQKSPLRKREREREREQNPSSSNSKCYFLCMYPRDHNRNCELAHSIEEYQPKLCRRNGSCSRPSPSSSCEFFHPRWETKRDYIERMMNIETSFFGKFRHKFQWIWKNVS